ncbi:zinc-dependent metalloprotease [Thermobifida alba]|uniref:Zinc-dependent metalloprotease n=1 Tax=Thermobifida alba TaxID=53522 RepID=A0ABY4L9A8_THEAE|nr:zinc-dependent metalloprotease [Thermobifida alba]UPT23033.1 zinc-dependent metalloprotease [Thermobifida alba]
MSDLPFGFSMSNDPDDESGRGPNDPGSGAGRGGSGGDFPNMPPGGFPFGDPQQIAQMLRQFADMMSAAQPASGPGQESGAGGVNWAAATNIARHVVSRYGDPSVGPVHYAQVQEALRLADLWLNEVTALPSGLHTMEAWSRAEWVEKTMPTWAKLCEPLTGRVVESMGQNLPQEMAAMAGPLLGMLRQMGGALVGQQAGQAIGELAREVVGSTDVGLPLAGEGRAALLPEGVKEFGEGLNVPLDEVRLYLAAREAAHHRLFGHVPWLRSHLFSLVEEYAAGMSFDASGLEERLGRLDITNPESLQEALSSLEGQGLFQTEDTPRQKASLARLETTLALVEGWVSTVVDAAVSQRLPQSAALGEALRRRRASGGPAEHTFAALVGLELRPRRLRDAAALWGALTEARGIDGRDAVWEHPDLMPSGADLDSPDAFVRGPDSSEHLDLSRLTEDPSPEERRGQDDGDDEDGR